MDAPHARVAEVARGAFVGGLEQVELAVLVEIFPTSIRYTGMSLAYNLCAILGGFTPSVAEWLIRTSNSNMSIMWLLIGAGALSFISVVTYKDQWRDPLPI